MYFKVKVLSLGKIQVSNIQVNGITTGCTVKAIWFILMVKSTSGILKMIYVTARVFINSVTRENMREVARRRSQNTNMFSFVNKLNRITIYIEEGSTSCKECF